MSEPVRQARRAKALSALLLVAVFLAGLLVGAAGDRALDRREHGDRGGRRGFEAELLESLRLDPAQRTAMEALLERRRAEAAAVWTEVKPRLNEVVARTREDVARVLTPEQLAEYDRQMAERQRRMEARWERPKGGT